MSNTNLFTAKKLALLGMFSALAFALTFLEIPIFPQIGLKLDFSFAFLLIGGYILGAFYTEILIVVVIGLCYFKSMSLGVGELANFIMANIFVFLPVLVYKWKKGITSVIIILSVASVLVIIASLFFNRFLFFPLYEKFLGVPADVAFKGSWYLIIIFNALKCVLNGTIAVLLYKRLKKSLTFFIK